MPTGSKEHKQHRFVSGVIDPITIIGVLFLIVTLGVGTYVINDKKFDFNIFEKAGSCTNVCLQSDFPELCGCTSSNIEQAPAGSGGITRRQVEEEIEENQQSQNNNNPPAPPTTPPAGCNADGVTYQSGAIVVGGSSLSGFSRCENNAWVPCPTCTITQLTTVPAYLQEQYNQAVQNILINQEIAEQTAPRPNDLPVKLSNNQQEQKDICLFDGGMWSNESMSCSYQTHQQLQEQVQVIQNQRARGETRCSGSTLETWNGSTWDQQNCPNGCTNGGCIADIQSFVEVERNENGTTRYLVTIIRDGDNNVLTSSRNPIDQSSSIEKVDDGFIRNFTTILRSKDTNEILSVLTQSVHSNQKEPDPQLLSFAYCNKDGASATEISECNQRMTGIYNAPLIGRYIQSYANQDITYNYEQMGFDSVSDCITNTTSYADRQRCNGYQPTKEQLASSVALGSATTAAGALIVAGGGLVAGGYALLTAGGSQALLAAGITTITQSIALGMATSTMYQTGSAVDICIISPDSPECRNAKFWAGVSWLNTGSSWAANTYQASKVAQGINTAVNLANIGFDYVDIKQSCGDGQFASDFGCVAAWGGLIFDVGQGGVDIFRSIDNNFTGLGSNIGSLPDPNVANNIRIDYPISPVTTIHKTAGIEENLPNINQSNSQSISAVPPNLQVSGTNKIELTRQQITSLSVDEIENLDPVIAAQKAKRNSTSEIAEVLTAPTSSITNPTTQSSPGVFGRIANWLEESPINLNNWGLFGSPAGDPVAVNPPTSNVTIPIGRSHQEGFFSTHATVSRNHGEININPDGSMTYRDTGSTVGSSYRSGNREFIPVPNDQAIIITPDTEIRLGNSAIVKVVNVNGTIKLVDVNYSQNQANIHITPNKTSVPIPIGKRHQVDFFGGALDSGASRDHGTVRYNESDGSLTYIDNGSTNGTYYREGPSGEFVKLDSNKPLQITPQTEIKLSKNGLPFRIVNDNGAITLVDISNIGTPKNSAVLHTYERPNQAVVAHNTDIISNPNKNEQFRTAFSQQDEVIVDGYRYVDGFMDNQGNLSIGNPTAESNISYYPVRIGKKAFDTVVGPDYQIFVTSSEVPDYIKSITKHTENALNLPHLNFAKPAVPANQNLGQKIVKAIDDFLNPPLGAIEPNLARWLNRNQPIVKPLSSVDNPTNITEINFRPGDLINDDGDLLPIPQLLVNNEPVGYVLYNRTTGEKSIPIMLKNDNKLIIPDGNEVEISFGQFNQVGEFESFKTNSPVIFINSNEINLSIVMQNETAFSKATRTISNAVERILTGKSPNMSVYPIPELGTKIVDLNNTTLKLKPQMIEAIKWANDNNITVLSSPYLGKTGIEIYGEEVPIAGKAFRDKNIIIIREDVLQRGDPNALAIFYHEAYGHVMGIQLPKTNVANRIINEILAQRAASLKLKELDIKAGPSIFENVIGFVERYRKITGKYPYILLDTLINTRKIEDLSGIKIVDSPSGVWDGVKNWWEGLKQSDNKIIKLFTNPNERGSLGVPLPQRGNTVTITLGRDFQPSLFGNQDNVSRQHGTITITQTGEIKYTDNSTNGTFYRNSPDEDFKFISKGQSITITPTTEIKLYDSQPIRISANGQEIKITDIQNGKTVTLGKIQNTNQNATNGFFETYVKDDDGWFPSLKPKYDSTSPVAIQINNELDKFSKSHTSFLDHIETVDAYIKDYGIPKYVFRSKIEATKLYDFQSDILKIKSVDQFEQIFENAISKLRSKGINVIVYDNLYEFMNNVGGGELNGVLGTFKPQQFTNGRRTGTVSIASPELIRRIFKITNDDISLETAKMITLQKIGHEGGHAFDWIGGLKNDDPWLTEIRQINFNYNFYRHIGNENEAAHYKNILDEFNLRFETTNKGQTGQTLVEFSTIMPAIIVLPTLGMYYFDQYFDLGITDSVLNSINESLEDGSKPMSIIDPAYDVINFWLKTSAVVYGLNNDKKLSEISIPNPNQRPYDEIIQEAIDNYTENNPDSEVYYASNPTRVPITRVAILTYLNLDQFGKLIIDDLFNSTRSSDAQYLIYTGLFNQIFGVNSGAQCAITNSSTAGLASKECQYDLNKITNNANELRYLIEQEVDIKKKPISQSFIIEYYLSKNNGDLTQSLMDTNNFLKLTSRSDTDISSENNYVWFQKNILDEYSPILPYSNLPIEEIKLSNGNIYYDFSLPNRIGEAYHTTHITSLLYFFPPELVSLMVLGEYSQFGNKHGLIKMSADLEVLKQLDDINNLLESYEQPSN